MEQSFPDPCLKNILKFLRFDKRASLARYIPYFHKLDSTETLSLDYFQFSDLSLIIDTVCYDFYEYWNFWIESPPSKKEVDRIRDQKHFGNLFFRKIDLIDRWEKKVPLELTQGKAEQLLIDFLIGRFEKVEIKMLKIENVDDFLRRIGEQRKGKILIRDLHVRIQNFEEFENLSAFLHPGSFPLKKLEIEMPGSTENLNLEHFAIKSVKNLWIKVEYSSEVLVLINKHLNLPHQPGSIFTLELPDGRYFDGLFVFLEEKCGFKKREIGKDSTVRINQNTVLKVFGGQVEPVKNHIYDILEKSFIWILKVEFLEE